MTTYFLSNSGSNTSPYDTEAKAATALLTLTALATNADLIKASSTHTENNGTSTTYTLPTTPGLKIESVLFNGSGTGAATAGASVNSNGNFNIAMGGCAHIYGFNFQVGTGSNQGGALYNIALGAQSHNLVFDTCTFWTNTTSSGGVNNLGGGANGSNKEIGLTFKNCTWRFGATSQTINLRQARFLFQGMTIHASGSAPTTLFSTGQAFISDFICEASDLTGKTWTNLVSLNLNHSKLVFRYCQLPTGYTLTTGSFSGPAGMEVHLIDCDTGDNHYTYIKSCWQGTVTAVNTIYVDASDGTNSISWHMVGNANASYQHPLQSPPIATFNSGTSAVTATAETNNDGTTFTDAQLWIETMAKTTTGSTKGTWDTSDRASSAIASGTNQTTSSATWVGTGGFSSPVKQKLVSGSFTPAEVGAIMSVINLAANDDVYVSPKVAIA